MSKRRQITELVVPRFYDTHAHVRETIQVHPAVKPIALVCSRANIEPNTKYPIHTAQQAIEYRDGPTDGRKWDLDWSILPVARRYNPDFEALMLIQIIPVAYESKVESECVRATTPETIFEAKDRIIAAKAYPQGVTTNSAFGIVDWRAKGLRDVFAAMMEVDLPLEIHGEMAGYPSCMRERKFLPVIRRILRNFGRLRVVMAHVSTKEGIAFIREMNQRGYTIVGSITPQHLWLTYDDVLGQPHNFCRPVACYEDDRRALIEAATSGEPYFVHGSDSAPHPILNKQQPRPPAKTPAGVFSAPAMLPILAHVFDQAGQLKRLANFACRFGERFFRLKPTTQELTLVRETNPTVRSESELRELRPFLTGDGLYRFDRPTRDFVPVHDLDFTIPLESEPRGFRPFLAGERLNWRVKG
ncbi:MAG: amidohydrolase family protein [Candidatus Berkelbacteria bacterium]|nr:amidohydrolase family protein [Candidatus Berkelbacteria bacterium]